MNVEDTRGDVFLLKSLYVIQEDTKCMSLFKLNTKQNVRERKTEKKEDL